SLPQGVLGVIGRNGMGKTTLCNAVMGLVPASAGSIRLAGIEILGVPSNEIVNLGVGYVPQGRRVWPSLTVDEHLRLLSRGSQRVAPSVASRVAILVNGRILPEMPARELAQDRELQQRLLGVHARGEEVEEAALPSQSEMAAPETVVFQVRRAALEEGVTPPPPPPAVQIARAPTFWTQGNPLRARSSQPGAEPKPAPA